MWFINYTIWMILVCRLPVVFPNVQCKYGRRIVVLGGDRVHHEVSQSIILDVQGYANKPDSRYIPAKHHVGNPLLRFSLSFGRCDLIDLLDRSILGAFAEMMTRTSRYTGLLPSATTHARATPTPFAVRYFFVALLLGFVLPTDEAQRLGWLFIRSFIHCQRGLRLLL